MSTKFAKKMVLEDSILGFTEAFVRGMKQRTDFIIENLSEHISPNILFNHLNEDYDTKLDNAIDHILEEVNQLGLDNLTETIEKIAPMYGINSADIVSIFESALETQETIVENNYGKLQQHLLSQLNNILDENSGNIVSFADTTSAYVTPQESQALVEVYSQLNSENKQKMVQKMIESKNTFNQVLGFANKTLAQGE